MDLSFEVKRARSSPHCVGAHHPTRFSNTYAFYQAGWRGINIDPMPGGMAAFNLLRQRNINLELAIAASDQTLAYYMFNEPALHGFSKTLIEPLEKVGLFHVIGQVAAKTRRLEVVLHEHLPAGQRIDFLTVDVEGFDLEVLDSNDWEQFRPTLVLAEGNGAFDLDQAMASPLVAFMKHHRYSCCAKTMHTLVFADQRMIAGNGIELSV